MKSKRHLHLDIESRSDLDLTKVGLHAYAAGKNTDIICACFSFDDSTEIREWCPGEPVPQDVFDHIEAGGEVWAHNASFERDMLNAIGTRKYGWPHFYTNQMVCTMAMAYAMGLPGTLEKCAAALGVSEQKDMEGSRLMKQLCRPREILADGRIIWWDDFDKTRRLIDYCKQDVRTERAASKRMLPLSLFETDVWRLDQLINNRGVRIDIAAAFTANKMVEDEKAELDEKMRFVSQGHIATCTAVGQIKKFLTDNGAGAGAVESIDKPSVIAFLADPSLPKVCRDVLELRSQSGKSSIAKLDPMITGAANDHRVRGNFQYSGANTRRWSGRRIQLHNLKRPELDHKVIEKIVLKLHDRSISRADFTMIYGEPMSVVSDLIRAMIIAEEGHEFIACDFSAIEARVVAWLANQTSALDIFSRGEDIYVSAACDIFGKKAVEITKSERAVGKVAILALGFGGGVGAFQQMAKGYNVTMAPAFDVLWARASERQKQQVEAAFKKNGHKSEISKAEHIASDLTKIFWREKNPQIVSYWSDLERSAIEAVKQPGALIQNKNQNIVYRMAGSFLWCRLPSGGVICYPYPEIKQSKTPWDTMKESLTYMAEDSETKQWMRFTTYGGSLTENCVQSVARDLLVDAMFRVEKENYPVVLHVHDELVCEMPKGKGKLSVLEKIMSEPPAWAKGLPLSAGGWVGERYRK